ncbi:uncharacterized protein LOC127789349 [Diospyros lotus]|uniref:uncharacterized protein LOC127789349 n=1 Tax=Diospyros lotus TaxID=55363 RepID=UPI002256A703|nr:uncharacterized protein LOC127789349 [Diospyros lotus]
MGSAAPANCRCRGELIRFYYPREVLGRSEIRFFFSYPKKLVGVRYSQSISLPHRKIQPVSLSSSPSSSQTQKLMLNEETQNQDASRTVHVKFRMQRRCAFGEQFHIVGDDPIFGSWDPSSATPLDWSEGHIWTVELDLPAGKTIQFKFIVKGTTGNILWQPGPNRILQTWETNNTISVSEDWDNAELQMIMEEEPTSSEQPESTNSIAENLAQPRAGLTAAAESESPSTEVIVSPLAKPLPESPMPVVAENIADLVGEPQRDSNEESMDLRIVANDDKKLVPDSNKDITSEENIFEDNGRTVTLKTWASTKEEGNLVFYEGDPLLVPGLPPLTTVDNDKTITSEATNDNGPGPECNQIIQPVLKKELKDESPHSRDSAEMMSIEEEEAHGNQNQVENPDSVKEQNQGNSKPVEDNVLESDIQWGRRTLQKLLTSFGFL